MIVAVDPGIRNLGVCIHDGTTLRMHVVDLSVGKHDGRLCRFPFEVSDIRERVSAFIDANAEIWPQVTQFVIEIQPPIGKAIFKQLAMAFAAMIQGRFPHITVREIRPQDVRKFWGIQGKTYLERKKKSAEAARFIMSDADAVRTHTAFRKADGKAHVDGVEAALLAVYARLHPPKPLKRVPLKTKVTGRASLSMKCDCVVRYHSC